jgi:ribonuclease E
MKKEMLINVLQPEECRIAIVENGVLEELYVERTSHESYVGNIYKGRIVNIEPSIQAAFVDFGVGRNGFLHVSDVEPQYYRHKLDGGDGERERHRDHLPDILELPDVNLMSEYEFEDDDDDDDDESEEEQSSSTDESAAGENETESERPETDEPAAPELGENVPEPDIAPSPESAGEDIVGLDSPRRVASAERRTAEEYSKLSAEALEVSDQPAEIAPAAAEAVEAATLTGELEANGHDEEAPLLDEDTSAAAPEEEAGDHMDVLEARTEGEEADRPRQRRRRGRRPMRPAGMGRPKPPIQEVFRRGQEVLVQVIKEGIGTKGPTLSTYISIPGRYLVLMPGLNRIGVSRKITDEDQRRRLREILGDLEPPKGLGFIIRTAGLDKTKKELRRDLAYLTRLWKVVVRRIKKLKAPASIYQESDMITRTIRDIFSNDIDTIFVDEQKAFDHAQEFLQIVMPRYADRIRHFAEGEPLFHRYAIEGEIARIQQSRLPLPAGGSLVIDQTEALVAIDVNSGNFRADNDAEETAYRINLLAAREIARQLRLRDLGGVVVIDFIDMREERHRRDVEQTLRDAVRRDRARTKILKMSAFGIVEMTRQRIRPSLKRSIYADCPCCNATGQVKTAESMSLDVMRLLQLASNRDNICEVNVHVADAVSQYLLNKKRREIAQLEENGKMSVTIVGTPGAPPETLDISCRDSNGSEIKVVLDAPTPTHRGRGHRER